MQSTNPDIAPVAIGDVQGCNDALHRLLADLATRASTPLWFTGDLVNRGPASAAALRSIMQLGIRATAVLGNHDLHLLGVAAGVRVAKAGDTVAEVLNAPDADAMIDWVRQLPLAHFDGSRLLVHAGVLPQWDVATALALASEVEAELRAPSWRKFLADVYSANSAAWHPGLKGAVRARTILDAFTRLRFCTLQGEMEFKYNGPPEIAPPGYLPWFNVPGRKTADVIVVFGHWAALGLLLRDNLCGLDTGCVWGKQLTAVQIDLDPTMRRKTQVGCADCASRVHIA